MTLTLRDYLIKNLAVPLTLNVGNPDNDNPEVGTGGAAFAIRMTDRNFALVQSYCMEYNKTAKAVVLNDGHRSVSLDWYVFNNQPSFTKGN